MKKMRNWQPTWHGWNPVKPKFCNMIRSGPRASIMMKQIEEMEEGNAKEIMKETFANAFLLKQKGKISNEDKREKKKHNKSNKSSTKSRHRYLLQVLVGWDLFASALPSYERDATPLLET